MELEGCGASSKVREVCCSPTAPESLPKVRVKTDLAFRRAAITPPWAQKIYKRDTAGPIEAQS